jgi:Kef-type K+ transport system membrane component KefB
LRWWCCCWLRGKGIACWAAARLSGEDNRSAMAIGALMNARGLMELIILNIGLERGIITPLLFAVMVVMAIATTLMATPIFEWIYGSVRRRTARTAPTPSLDAPCFKKCLLVCNSYLTYV